MPFSTSVCRTAAVRKVEGACRLSCSCGPGQWPGRDVDGQENGAEGPTAFGSGEKRNHPWADWQARSSLEPSAHQAITPGPCRGRVSRWLVQPGKPPGDPSQRAEETQINRTRVVRLAEKLPSGPAAGDGWAGRAHGSRRRCALGVPQGMRRSAGQGPRRRRRARLTGNGGGQEPLRPLRRGREAPRLELPDSTGSVPLQSG